MFDKDYVSEGWGEEDCYPEHDTTEIVRKEKGCFGCRNYMQWHEHGCDYFDCRIGNLPENRTVPYSHKPLRCHIKMFFRGRKKICK